MSNLGYRLRWGNPGVPGKPNKAWEEENLVWLDLPYRMDNAFDGKPDDQTITRIRVHRKAKDAFLRAFWNVIYAAEAKVRETSWWAEQRILLKRQYPNQTTAFYDNKMAGWVRDRALKMISIFGGDVFSGSTVLRFIRGYEKKQVLSPHSFGIAIDIDSARNPMGKPLRTTFPEWFVKAFEDAGFTWGGRWKNRPDSMHFEVK
jgi:hypothetical protein